jgi:c-di-GMP-binding flagellar brake protein YcgR
MMLETSLDSSASHQEERRRYVRCKVTVQLELHPDGMAAPFRTTTSDISPGGCYVETMFTLDVGTKLKMKLWLDSVSLSTTGIVTTRHPQVGNGIQFTSLDDGDVRKLEQFLADHAVAGERVSSRVKMVCPTSTGQVTIY